MTWNLTKLGHLGPTPGSKPQIHDPIRQNRVLGNPGELLLGIKPKKFGSIAHPKPPIMRLHPDGLFIYKLSRNY